MTTSDFASTVENRFTPAANLCSSISHIYWSPDGNMIITFRDQNNSVLYKEVPYEIYNLVTRADSIGAMFNRIVRGRYRYETVPTPDEHPLLRHVIDTEYKKLEHHMHATCGLWATDRPDLIPAELKPLFFQINY